MRIANIALDEQELPGEISVVMSRKEAVLIARLVGSVTGPSPEHSSIWNALNGSVFNRFWDDGLNDAEMED